MKSNMVQSKLQFFTLLDSYNGVANHFFILRGKTEPISRITDTSGKVLGSKVPGNK